MDGSAVNWLPWRRPSRLPSSSSSSSPASRRSNLRGDFRAAARSLLAFGAGLVLASCYGATALFLEGAPLWTCVYVTLAVATVTGFGMGMSVRVRTAISLMLPSLCSAHGRNFLLLASTAVLVSGPVANTLENSEQAAASLLCGAELAANQTRQLMRNAATPLLAALDHIRQIGRNAAAMAARVNKLIGSLSDGIRHVARTMRNVFHFLSDLGNVCNAKLGAPYRKCRAIFVRAKGDCVAQLRDFNFLCGIVEGFMHLCELAKAPKLFCSIPEYVSSQLKKHLAEPVISAFRRMRSHFDFSLSVSAALEVDANVSRSLHQTAQEILDQLIWDLKVFTKLRGPLVWAGLLLLTCSLIRAVQYQRKYLTHLNFENIYITAQFVKLDRQLTSEGGASILPITRRESQIYIRPLSPWLTRRECRSVLVGVAWVTRHMLMSAVLVALDFLVFWLLDQVQRQVQGGVVARAPVKVAVEVQGSGYMADIMRDLAVSFNVLQAGNVTVISHKCLFVPSEPDYTSCFAIGFLLGVALLVTLAGGIVRRSRRLICAYFHPDTEMARIHFLRQQILDERRAAGRALLRAAARMSAKGAKPCGRLWALLQRLPGGGAYLSEMCVACGGRAGLAPFVCDVNRCPGVFCKPCFKRGGKMCHVCARPTTFQEDSQEEPDSSEDEREDTRQDARQADVSAGRPEPPSLEPSASQSFFSSAFGFLQDFGGRGPTPH
ncbi:DC-STAMP domain-containing protein 2 isoform X1 [Hippocampus comes]|uniref:DC-STAMP domain-containing protein 2 isoform X1 n=1 Tax=Hippocampus comes TaxID=109280 RepID=UPI00094E19B0|nr:PREDICTED: DC-STAMP domain-containing protein 2 isoform X1 [Hippocampus comes]